MQNSLQRGGNTSQSRLSEEHITQRGGRGTRVQSLEATRGYSHNGGKLGSLLKTRAAVQANVWLKCQVLTGISS